MQSFRTRFWPIHDPEISLSETERKAVEIIGWAYDGTIAARDRRYAQSVVWRSEQHFGGNHQTPRWAKRVHLFNVPTTDLHTDPHHADLHDLVHDDRIAYVGFLDMRPHLQSAATESRSRVIAEAMLTVPTHFTDRRWRMAGVGMHSEYFGSPAFPCLPYAMPQEHVGGRCAQACLFMATTCAIPLGATALGPYEFTLLAGNAQPGQPVPVSGLTPYQMVTALRAGPNQGKINALHETASRVGEGDGVGPARQFLTEQVKPYLEAGLPVVIGVDFEKLHGAWGWEQLGGKKEKGDAFPHAVMLIGYAECRGSTVYAYNDPSIAPFLQISEADLAQAILWSPKPGQSGARRKKNNPVEYEAHALLAVPAPVRLRLSPITAGFVQNYHCHGFRLLPGDEVPSYLARIWQLVDPTRWGHPGGSLELQQRIQAQRKEWPGYAWCMELSPYDQQENRLIVVEDATRRFPKPRSVSGESKPSTKVDDRFRIVECFLIGKDYPTGMIWVRPGDPRSGWAAVDLGAA